MRNKIAIGLVLLAVLSLPLAAVQAQSGGELVFGEWIEGTLTASEYEHEYTFQGAAGDVILITMLTQPGTYDLDPAFLLRDSAGNVLVEVDDIVGLNAAAVLELAADGEYSILATRSGGATGSSDGAYILRVAEVELLGPGSTVEATVNSMPEKDMPNLFVLRPDQAVTWAIDFSQPESELHAMYELLMMPDDEAVFSLSETTGVRSGTLNVDLDADVFYILIVQQNYFSFVYDDITLPVTITVSEAE